MQRKHDARSHPGGRKASSVRESARAMPERCASLRPRAGKPPICHRRSARFQGCPLITFDHDRSSMSSSGANKSVSSAGSEHVSITVWPATSTVDMMSRSRAWRIRAEQTGHAHTDPQDRMMPFTRCPHRLSLSRSVETRIRWLTARRRRSRRETMTSPMSGQSSSSTTTSRVSGANPSPQCLYCHWVPSHRYT